MPRLLAPGGRLLVVGLAAPHTLLDHLWDTASAITNPLIGWVKHPWPSPDPHQVTDPPYPVREPTLTFDEIAAVTRRVLPGPECATTWASGTPSPGPPPTTPGPDDLR